MLTPLPRRTAAALAIAALVTTACSSGDTDGDTDSAGADPSASESPLPAPVPSAGETSADIEFGRTLQTELRVLPAEFPVVRGVYSTKWSFWGERWERLLELIRTTELNAIVIDVKDDRGEVSWEMDLDLAQVPGASDWANTVPSLERARDRVMQLRALGGYPIARVVCFKDSAVARARPDLAVIDTRTGQPWEGRDGQLWLNAYNDEAWQHCIDVGKQAAAAGFLEVQFDYVRFPNGGDGPSKYFSFPGVPADRPEEEWRHPAEITEFLAAAAEQLHEVGARVSADVFGLTTYNFSWNGDGTGQVWEQLVEHLDYISPMVYPSHYIGGNYGLNPHPQQFPYELIKYSMEEAQLRTVGAPAKVRPWLEDFGSPWLGSASVAHTPQRLADQIRGAAEKGIDSWMLWNAGNTYSVDALADEMILRALEWEPDPTSLEGSGGDVRGEESMQWILERTTEIETPTDRRAREAAEEAERAEAEAQASEAEASEAEASESAAEAEASEDEGGA